MEGLISSIQVAPFEGPPPTPSPDRVPLSLCGASPRPSSPPTPSQLKHNLFLLTWLGASRGWLQGRGMWSAACRTPEVEAERPRR